MEPIEPDPAVDATLPRTQSLVALRQKVAKLYTAGDFNSAKQALEGLERLGGQDKAWWEYSLMLAGALGDAESANSAIEVLASDPDSLLPALRNAWSNATAHKHWELAKPLGRRLYQLVSHDVNLRVLNLLDALDAGTSKQDDLKQMMAEPLPMATFSTEVLRRLIAALNTGGFNDDAGRMLDYLLVKYPPDTTADKERTALLACQVKRYAQAVRLVADTSSLSGRYLCSLSSHLAMDWPSFKRSQLSRAELTALLGNEPDWQPAMLFRFLMLPGYSDADYLALSQRAAPLAKPEKRCQHIAPMTRPQRLRVGYLSGDFKIHPCTYLVTPVFESLDKRRFEWIAVDNSREDNSLERQRILSCFDAVIPARHLGTVELAQRIRVAKIDVLVDLSGHTTDNRLDVMALHPAPIQITWLGYPGGLGGELADYIITDTISAPQGADADFGEVLIRLPVSDRPGGDRTVALSSPPPRAKLGLSEGILVLACFNQQAKITESTFDIWCELMREVTDSVLWMIDEGESGRLALQAALKQRGVNSDRLIWADRIPHQQHLQRMACADLMLDTHPYTMHTTAVDTLTCGVPYLTYCGETLASRVSASLLHTAGLADCVCSGVDEYRQRLLLTATDPAYRAQLRQRFEAARTKSPLFDSRRFASYLEQAYDRAYGRWLGGLSPAPFTIEAQSISSETRAESLGV